ncbi:MAG TPA: type IV pilus twitching motility protein PilT [bacterium]|nr:type IV pilus twitching motility protein PilT [bacterium]
MATIDEMFKTMVERKASDMHLTIGNPPLIRAKGELVPLADWVLTEQVMHVLIYETMTPEQWELSWARHDYDYAYEVPGLARFRANVFFNQQGMAAVFRTIPAKILTLDDLGMPPVLKQLAKIKRGLILVTGPTGSGKSTTLAAVIDDINSNREANILTIEDPIEFVHPVKKCKITQREVHRDTHSFKAALRSSMRQDPDIILVGEMRDYETISLAIAAAEMGVLVFGTLHTNSAAKTIDRIINVFPPDERDKARSALAASTKGIVAQQLCPTKDGKGRCAAVEILNYDKSLSNLIRTGKVSGIQALIEMSAKNGMQTMDQCLMKYIEEGKITAEQAYLKANDKKKFQALMEKEAAEAPQ